MKFLNYAMFWVLLNVYKFIQGLQVKYKPTVDKVPYNVLICK